MKGRARQVYMNLETEEKAKKICERYAISMSALIRIALEDYIERIEAREEDGE